MGDRIDIDALLISALYGELTPADEARLTAHLESHPADRTALADLTQIRATVHESRLLAVQFDPPQSVSAMLLQEAARRAPRPVRSRASGSEGWFQRFVRSFTAHPAMAAAMTLVLIVGVASTLYVRRADKFDAAPAPELTRAAPADNEMMRDPAAAPAPAGAGAAGSAAAPGAPADDLSLGNAAAAPGSAPVVAAVPPPAPAARGAMAPQNDLSKLRAEGDATGGLAQAPSPAPAKADTAQFKKGGGIEVAAHEEMAPKDLDAKKIARADGAAAYGTDRAQGPAGAAAAMPAKPQPATPAAIAADEPEQAYARAPVVNGVSGAGAAAGSKDKLAKSANATAQTITADRRLAKEPPPPPAAEPMADAKPESKAEKSAEDQALVGWAQKQREQVIAYVRANNCRAAASAATEIYNRAPDYYASNVEVDRTIKPCLPYLTSERERSERSRAALKRAKAADTAPQAAPPAPTRK